MRTSLEKAHPQEILDCALKTYGDRLVVVTSFQPTGIVTLHMLRDTHVPVITLDTGLLFPETYQLIDQLEHEFNLNLIRIKPDVEAIAQSDHLWQTHPDQCCHLRKTQPLKRALAGYSAWITGLRRDQAPTRSQIPIVSEDSRYGLVKICPFANWTEDMIWTYIHAHDLPYNELHDQGYSSIGCWPCTQPPVDDDLRSGRWRGHNKTECGIHVELVND